MITYTKKLKLPIWQALCMYSRLCKIALNCVLKKRVESLVGFSSFLVILRQDITIAGNGEKAAF